MSPAQAQQERPQTHARARPETNALRPEVHAQTQTEAGCLAGEGSGDPTSSVWGAGSPRVKSRVVCDLEGRVGATVVSARRPGSAEIGCSWAGAATRSSSTGQVGASKSDGDEPTSCRHAVAKPSVRTDDDSREGIYLCKGSEPVKNPTRSFDINAGAPEVQGCSDSSRVLDARRAEDIAVSFALGSPDTQEKVCLEEKFEEREIAVVGIEERRQKPGWTSTSGGSDICGIVEACLNVAVSMPAQDVHRAVPVDPQTRRRNEVEERFTAPTRTAAVAGVRRSSSPSVLRGRDSALLPRASSCVVRGNLVTEDTVEAQHQALEASPTSGGAGDSKQDEELTIMTTGAEKVVGVDHKEVEVRLRARPELALSVITACYTKHQFMAAGL